MLEWCTHSGDCSSNVCMNGVPYKGGERFEVRLSLFLKLLGRVTTPRKSFPRYCTIVPFLYLTQYRN